VSVLAALPGVTDVFSQIKAATLALPTQRGGSSGGGGAGGGEGDALPVAGACTPSAALGALLVGSPGGDGAGAGMSPHAGLVTQLPGGPPPSFGEEAVADFLSSVRSRTWRLDVVTVHDWGVELATDAHGRVAAQWRPLRDACGPASTSSSLSSSSSSSSSGALPMHLCLEVT
jgi:hypothetical protein